MKISTVTSSEWMIDRLAMLEQNAIKNAVPQEVVEAHVLHDVPLIRAWREHLNVAELAGMKQSALARLERDEGKPRKATLKKLADAML